MRLYDINANQNHRMPLRQGTRAVYYDKNIGEWFRTTVGVRQGCLLSATLLNIFLERIMVEALEDHEGTLGIGGRTITN